MGYYANAYKARGRLFLATNSDLPYCGYHHLLEMRLGADAAKTAGEVKITVPENPVTVITAYAKICYFYNKIEYKFYIFFFYSRSGTDLNPGSTIKKMIVTKQDLLTVDNIKIEFKKKKIWFGKDPNGPSFILDLLKLTNVEINES
jgi:hypothetical protein